MVDSDSIAKVGKSKTAQAVEYFFAHQGEGVTPFQAAMKFNLYPTALYKKLKTLAATEDRRCPCCHQIIAADDKKGPHA